MIEKMKLLFTALVSGLLVHSFAKAYPKDEPSGAMSMRKMLMGVESNKMKRKKCDSFCGRPSPYSTVSPNEDWGDAHTYHPQVWYLSLEDIHALWEKNDFDYVLDVRGIEDVELGGNLLPGWQTEHIPGSFPTDIDCLTGDCDALTLSHFLSSGACLDAKIFVHCLVGVAANNAAKILIDLGFTNLYAAGPQGTAGYFQRKDMGYPIVYEDMYDSDKFVPECAAKCY